MLNLTLTNFNFVFRHYLYEETVNSKDLIYVIMNTNHTDTMCLYFSLAISQISIARGKITFSSTLYELCLHLALQLI